MTSNHHLVAELLESAGPRTSQQIGEALRIRPSVAGSLARQLAKKGFARRLKGRRWALTVDGVIILPTWDAEREEQRRCP